MIFFVNFHLLHKPDNEKFIVAGKEIQVDLHFSKNVQLLFEIDDKLPCLILLKEINAKLSELFKKFVCLCEIEKR